MRPSTPHLSRQLGVLRHEVDVLGGVAPVLVEPEKAALITAVVDVAEREGVVGRARVRIKRALPPVHRVGTEEEFPDARGVGCGVAAQRAERVAR